MTGKEFLQLVGLLLKYRAMFALSHRYRDTIDLIAQECVQRALTSMDYPAPSDDIPF